MFTPVKGRALIVTGGSRGIGKGIAGVFVREGANVLIADEGMLSAAAEELAAGAQGKVEATVADVSRVGDCRRLAQTASGSAGSTSSAPTPVSSQTGLWPS